jgi:hypothetical protein
MENPLSQLHVELLNMRIRLKGTPKERKKTQYHNHDLNSELPNTTQKYSRPGQSVVQYLYHPAISSAIRVTQSHDSVSPGWHSYSQTLTLRNSEVRGLYT